MSSKLLDKWSKCMTVPKPKPDYNILNSLDVKNKSGTIQSKVRVQLNCFEDNFYTFSPNK